MQSKLFRHIYSTTLVTTLLAGTPLVLPSSHAFAAEQTAVASLSIDQAVEKALQNNVDLELLRLAADTTYYDSLMTIQDSNAIKAADIYTLGDAQNKYEDSAEAKRDIVTDKATMDELKSKLQLDVQKAYFEVLAIEAKIKLQKQSIQRHYWFPSSNDEAKQTLRKLESEYQQAIAKLNDLIQESTDKEWNLASYDLVTYKLPALEKVQADAFENRPDMIKAEAERSLAETKVIIIDKYSAVSTYQGKIARNNLKKFEILLAKTKAQVEKEIGENYEKVVSAKKDLDDSKAARDEAKKQYDTTWQDYLNGNISRDELIEQEASLLESETKAVESIFQYNVAVVTLKQSVGI